MRPEGDEHCDQTEKANKKSNLAAVRDDRERSHTTEDRAEQRPPVQIPIFQNQPLHHIEVHASCPSLLRATFATKISSRVIVSTACTVAPTSWQAETIAGS